MLRSREPRNQKTLRCAAIVPSYGHHVLFLVFIIGGNKEPRQSGARTILKKIRDEDMRGATFPRR
jgi:hypothetical protein